MKVGFLHVGPDDRLARIMVRSCLDFDYEIVQMTDEVTRAIDGCEVVRLPWDQTKLMTYRLRHLAEFNEPELTVLDTDTVVMKDISGVWSKSFDVALTKRGPTYDPAGVNVAESMPYNIGVMFCREPAFWKVCLDVCESLPLKRQEWWGDQLAVKAASEKFDLLELDCDPWNYTPQVPSDLGDQAMVLHYKGPRKLWMLERFNGTML